MKVTNVRVYDLDETITESGLPHSTEPEYSLYRMQRLSATTIGSGHDCALKGIIVRCRLEADHSFWQQWQRYHFQDIVSSNSKMNCITNMELNYHPLVINTTREFLENTINMYNQSDDNKTQELFETIIMNVPLGLMLKAGVVTNYLQLKTIYSQRKHHKMSSWKLFCEWIETLPLSKELITQ